MEQQNKTFFERLRKFVGGIIAGNADNDPAGITTYSVAGATTGYSQLWLMVLAAPMLIAVQSMCARIGNVTRQGLGAVIKQQFPKPVAYLTIFVLLVSTIVAIGADLAGMGAAFQLVFHVPLRLWIVPVALLIWLVVLFTKFESITKYLLAVVVFYFAYVVSALMSRPDWAEVGTHLFVPTVDFNVDSLQSAVGILGATLTPTVFFWQAESEIEESETGKARRKKAHRMNLVLAPGFIYAQAIVIFIIIATAATLHKNHIEIKSAVDAARALEPLAGPFAKYLFAVGIIGAGLMAVPVMAASAGYMVAELFNWRQSLSDEIDRAKGFYIVITLALFIGVEIAISGIDPIKALFYSQMFAGFVSPVLVLLLMVMANRKSVMGRFTNTLFDNVFGAVCLVVMLGTVILLVVSGG